MLTCHFRFRPESIRGCPFFPPLVSTGLQSVRGEDDFIRAVVFGFVRDGAVNALAFIGIHVCFRLHRFVSTVRGAMLLKSSRSCALKWLMSKKPRATRSAASHERFHGMIFMRLPPAVRERHRFRRPRR